MNELYEDGAAGQYWGPKEAATKTWCISGTARGAFGMKAEGELLVSAFGAEGRCLWALSERCLRQEG